MAQSYLVYRRAISLGGLMPEAHTCRRHSFHFRGRENTCRHHNFPLLSLVLALPAKCLNTTGGASPTSR